MKDLLFKVCPVEELPVPEVQCRHFPHKACLKCSETKTYKAADLILHNVEDLTGLIRTAKPKGIELPDEPEDVEDLVQADAPAIVKAEPKPLRPFPAAVGFVVTGAAVITGGLLWALILRFMRK